MAKEGVVWGECVARARSGSCEGDEVQKWMRQRRWDGGWWSSGEAAQDSMVR